MKKADFILIAAVILAVGILLFFLYGVNSNSGAYVTVEVDGKVVDTLPLDKDATKQITGKNGESNTLVIKDGQAKMTQANCRDSICKNHKAISRNGESIICLPHKVVISVVNENDTDEVDAAA